MRNVAVSAISIILAACGGPALQKTATSVPKRDLTLTTAAAPALQVASGIELATTRTTHRSRSRRAAAPVFVEPAPPTPETQPGPAPDPVSVSEPAPVPAVAEAMEPAPSGRELAPGATVTVIPVSTGPSGGGLGGGEEWAEAPVGSGHGGVVIGGWGRGHCGSGGGEGPVSILR